jgi:hypothetical protein
VYQQQQQEQQEQEQAQQQDAENPFLDPPFSRIKTLIRQSAGQARRREEEEDCKRIPILPLSKYDS